MHDLNLELDKQLEQILLKSNKLVCGHLMGAYLSMIKGQGLHFEDIRRYVPGDDIRHINWNVTARAGAPHIQRFIEEKENNWVFVIDTSSSFQWSSSSILRLQIAAHIVALISLLAIKHGDKISTITFSDTVHDYLPPNSSIDGISKSVRLILHSAQSSAGFDFDSVITQINSQNQTRSNVVIISDFNTDKAKLEPLSSLSQKHEIFPITLDDERERTFSGGGLIQFRDSESGGKKWVDTSDPKIQALFTQQMNQRIQNQQQLFSDLGLKLFRHNSGHNLKNFLFTLFGAD